MTSRASVARTLGWSVLVVLPVWWQPRVISSDLASHTYNAWLALEVERLGLEGLAVVPQATNVLFDLLLGFLLRHLPAATAERIAVAGAVLAFFYGASRLIRAVRGSGDPATWAVLFALTHGWVVQQGLFNYLLAVAGSLWFLAVAWGRGGRGLLAGIPFLVVAALGNPLPPLWAMSVLAFIAFARRWPGVRTWLAFTIAVAAVRGALALPGWPLEFWWRRDQVLYALGADQLITFSAFGLVPAVVLIAHWILCAAAEARTGGPRAVVARPEVLALLATVACVLVLPAGFRIPAHDSLVSLIPQRQSLAVAVIAVAAFGPAGGGASRTVAFGVAASTLALLLAGHAGVTSMERDVARQLAGVPDGARVIGGAQYRNTRVGYYQLAERPCLGRCWSYGNYEPSSGQFRLRATAPNPRVMADVAGVQDLHMGRYVVRPADVPAFALENCPATANRYCLRAVAPGDTVGRP